MAFEYTKQPWEEEIIGIDFSRRIPVGTTIQDKETVIEEMVGLTGQNPADYEGNHLELGTPSLVGTKEKILAVLVLKGYANFKYRVSFRVTLSDGQKKEDDIWVIVKES